MGLFDVSEAELAPICRRHRIRKLSLFGSRLKGTARPDSDVDLLVEFEPDAVPGLLGIAAMELDRLPSAGQGADGQDAILRIGPEQVPHEKVAPVKFLVVF